MESVQRENKEVWRRYKILETLVVQNHLTMPSFPDLTPFFETEAGAASTAQDEGPTDATTANAEGGGGGGGGEGEVSHHQQQQYQHNQGLLMAYNDKHVGSEEGHEEDEEDEDGEGEQDVDQDLSRYSALMSSSSSQQQQQQPQRQEQRMDARVQEIRRLQ